MEPKGECSCSSKGIQWMGNTDYDGSSFFFIENHIIQDKIKGRPHETTKHQHVILFSWQYSPIKCNWIIKKQNLSNQSQIIFDLHCPHWLPEPSTVQRGCLRVHSQPRRKGFRFKLGLLCLFSPKNSDVLLFGKSVSRHSRRWRGQTLYWGVFKDGCGVWGRRVGVFWGGGGAAAARGCSWLVRVLGQKREGRVDGGGVWLWVVVLITGQSVAHIIRCVWKLFIKPPRMLQQIEIYQSMINF